jgi:hypothetical protein
MGESQLFEVETEAVLHWTPSHVARPESGQLVEYIGLRGQVLRGVYLRGQFRDRNDDALKYVPSMWRGV